MTRLTHGKSKTEEYRLWSAMKSRCLNKNNPAYPDYGGRGITVCDRWLSFENFYGDLGHRPDGLTIERIDNDAGYSPDNVRWATRKEQILNRRKTKVVIWNGVKTPVAILAERHGVKNSTVWARIRAGWPWIDAATSPIIPQKHRNHTKKKTSELKTHCSKGHQFTQINTTYVKTRPSCRVCIACRKNSQKMWEKKRRAQNLSEPDPQYR